MRCRKLIAAAVAPALIATITATSFPANAEGSNQIDDVRCMIVSMALPKEEGEAAPTAAMISVMFFLGRIEGRDPDFDVKRAIGGQMAVMTADDKRTEGKRCIKEMLEKGKAAEQLGIDLINQGMIPVRPM